jgi:hypothetical protein
MEMERRLIAMEVLLLPVAHGKINPTTEIDPPLPSIFRPSPTPRWLNAEIYSDLVGGLFKSPFLVDSAPHCFKVFYVSLVRDTPHNMLRIRVLRNVISVFEISVMREPAKSFCVEGACALAGFRSPRLTR